MHVAVNVAKSLHSTFQQCSFSSHEGEHKLSLTDDADIDLSWCLQGGRVIEQAWRMLKKILTQQDEQRLCSKKGKTA
jgi:hypothetical protein